MTLTKFLPSAEGAVKIAVVTIGVLAVLTYVVPVLWAARLGVQPQNSKLRLVQ
jgi:hypothetical protein